MHLASTKVSLHGHIDKATCLPRIAVVAHSEQNHGVRSDNAIGIDRPVERGWIFGIQELGLDGKLRHKPCSTVVEESQYVR